MRAAEKPCYHRSRHSCPKIVRLNSRQYQIRTAIFLNGIGQCRSYCEFIRAFELWIQEMNGPIGAHRKSGTQHTSGFITAHRNDHNLTTMLFFEAKRFLESVVVRLTGNEGQVLIFDPGFVFIDSQPRCRVRHGFNTADDLHSILRLAFFDSIASGMRAPSMAQTQHDAMLELMRRSRRRKSFLRPLLWRLASFR